MDALTDATCPAGLHVLVVDDDALLCYLMETILTYDGHTVDTAVNGQEGWEKFQTAGFDVVIVDWLMPGMRGDQLAVAIKQVAPATRVVMITGSDTRRLVAQKCLPGVDVLLPKPFAWEELREALQESAVQGGKQASTSYV